MVCKAELEEGATGCTNCGRGKPSSRRVPGTVESGNSAPSPSEAPATDKSSPKTKRIVSIVALVLIIALIAAAVGISSTPKSAGDTSVRTHLAIYNSLSLQITDVDVVVNGASVKHLAIYNGYWADFGTFDIRGEQFQLVIGYYDGVTKTKTSTTSYLISNSYPNGVGINIYATSITKVGLPSSMLNPTVADLTPRPPVDNNVPASLHVVMNYERVDYATYDIGAVNHLVYRFYFEDASGHMVWETGKLNLTIFNGIGNAVGWVNRTITSLDYEYPSEMSVALIISSSKISGAVLDAKTFTAEYSTSSLIYLSTSGTIKGPY